MTPTQLAAATTKELLIAYKNKARCNYSKSAISIYNQLEKIIGTEGLYDLRLSVWHMQHGEGDAEFNEQCDKLIKLY